MQIADILRREIKKHGISRYKISQDTGIDQTTLYRLVHGLGGVSLETLGQLLEYFDLEIVPKYKTNKKRRR